MQEDDMAKELHLGSEIRELKLGSSITNNSTKFHTVKYDFKPASVDDSKMATIDVGSSNSVSVTVPHLDGAGTPHTVFKGSQKAYDKEYVFIFDSITGEITLEKLSANIQVKKIRSDPRQNSSNSYYTEPVEKSPTSGRTNGRTKVISGKKREPFVQLHPKQNLHHTTPYDKISSHNTSTNKLHTEHLKLKEINEFEQISPVQSSSGQILASLPMIGDNDDFERSVPIISAPPIQNRISLPLPIIDTKSTTLESDSSSSSSSSDSTSSSDSEAEITSAQIINDHLNNTTANTTASPTLYMPNNFLNDDLQLSESESDSDN